MENGQFNKYCRTLATILPLSLRIYRCVFWNVNVTLIDLELFKIVRVHYQLIMCGCECFSITF
jgi:hypothetical protein